MALAEAAVLQPDDLPPDWRECCEPLTFHQETLEDHVCGTPAGVPPRTAGYQRQYGRSFRDDYDMFVVSWAAVAATEPAAASEFTAMDSPAREIYRVEHVEIENSNTLNAPVSDFGTTYTPEAIDLGVPAAMDRLCTDLHDRW